MSILFGFISRCFRPPSVSVLYTTRNFVILTTVFFATHFDMVIVLTRDNVQEKKFGFRSVNFTVFIRFSGSISTVNRKVRKFSKNEQLRRQTIRHLREIKKRFRRDKKQFFKKHIPLDPYTFFASLKIQNPGTGTLWFLRSQLEEFGSKLLANLNFGIGFLLARHPMSGNRKIGRTNVYWHIVFIRPKLCTKSDLKVRFRFWFIFELGFRFGS